MKYVIILALLVATGCIVRGPKFTRIEKVLELKLGMSQAQVDSILDIPPYDIVEIDSVGSRTLIYKYRVTDRRTVPLFLKDKNGKEIRGKFSDLYCSYDSTGILLKLSSGETDTELKEKRINLNNILTLLTVTVPAFLVYLGITAP